MQNFKKLSLQFLSLALALVLVFGCCQGVFAATPSSEANASATLAYTLKGLPLGRAIQNFYVGVNYIYITQRVDATTYVSRLKIDGNIATYMDRMTMNNCGHGQSLDFYSYNGKEYLLMGCKSDTPADSTYNWSLQMARFQYEAGKTYDYTELNRLSYMNYANKNLTRLGTTYRVAGAVNGSYTIFRIQTKEGTVTYSAYNTNKLNALLDKSESVRMDTADAKAACSFSFTQSGSGIIRPNGSFQGIDMSSTKSIYLSGGADGDVPQIARTNSSGSYLKLIKVTNVGNLEIEGVQCKRGNVYFIIVPSTVAADKKEKHKIYYIPETIFGITHTISTVAGKAATCTATGLTEGAKCTTCNQPLDVQEIIPALGHSVVNVPQIPATCTTDGMTAGTKCSRCNVILSGCTTVYAPGHTAVEIPGVDATCTTDGVVAGTKCATCGVILSGGQTIPATGHKVVEVPEVEGNCMTEGRTAGTKCEICNTVLSGCEVVPAEGHQVEILPGAEPTCTGSGMTAGEKCALCGEILKAQQILPRLGHDYTYENLGQSHTATCTRCEKRLTGEHAYENGSCICGAKEVIEPSVDETITLNHTLNLASDISVNFAVRMDAMKDYVNHYLVCEIPQYENGVRTGTTSVTVEPVVNGSFYYYTLSGLTAVQMGDVVTAQLHMFKDGKEFVSSVDSYSVAQYAYAQLDKTNVPDRLKALCADLLRYGKEAQIYKNYRTDALVDEKMTEAHRAFLSDAEAVPFGNHNETLNDLDNPVIKWVGKSLSLDSKVAVKYVFDLGTYTGSVENLSLKVSYVNHTGEKVEAVIPHAEPYSNSTTRYAFTFDKLLAAELRTVVEVAVYEGDTRLSQTMRYSPDTYGNNKTGQLLTLCKVLFAYSDTAKAYFAG
ncbi:MAG: hypothetical protein IKM59_07585 [Oscillospiraceae bacterium]|nr:hypothetical protein [Oscillospiraceae bacterium]